MDRFRSDVKHAFRAFRKSPGFVITALAVLALGIGATTAIFSLVNTVLLKPIPSVAPDRLIALGISASSGFAWNASPSRVAYWRRQSNIFDEVIAWANRTMNYTGGDIVEQWHSMEVTSGFFRCWRMPILQGQTFRQEDNLPNGPRVAILGENLWTRRFARDPHILGKTVLLSGESYLVIGVAAVNPLLTEFGPLPDLFVPFQIDPDSRDVGIYFSAVGLLKPGITLQQAKERLRAATPEYRARCPNDFGPRDTFTAVPFRQALVRDARPLLLILLGAVGFVLLIACANVANLLLARLTGRRREIAIREALGAGRGRIVLQLLTESVMLSVAAGTLGLFIGYAAIRTLLVLNTADLPLIGEKGAAVTMDLPMTLFSVAISLLTGILFGLLPALHSSRSDLNSTLKDGSVQSGAGRKPKFSRAMLVAGEMSLAVVLLIGAGLLIRTFASLYAVDRGFDTRNVVTTRMSLTGPKYARSKDVAETVQTGLQHLRSLPGVEAAAAACCLPLEDGTYDLGFEIAGRPRADSRDVGWAAVSPGFFDVFKMPLKRGRGFSARDDARSAGVVIINESMARRYWPGRDPLQDRIVIGKELPQYFKDEPVRQIVGIVGDVRDESLDTAPHPIMSVPLAQLPDAATAFFGCLMPLAWAVRARTGPRAMLPIVREHLRQATGSPVTEGLSMDTVVSLSTRRQQFNMLLMSMFGCSALLLAAVGIYGLMSYTVEQRTAEIAIRVALGAESSRIRTMVIRQGMSLALAGLAAGTVTAGGLSRLIESLLFGVNSRDPLVFVVVPVLLAAVALVSVWVPANRASQVDPIAALRSE